MNKIETMIEEIEQLNANTSDEVAVDSDTILVDLIENVDFKFEGLSQDIFNIWKNSSDKKSVEQMFFEFMAWNLLSIYGNARKK